MPGYQWDAEQQAFLYPSGKQVTRAQLDRILDASINKVSANMTALTQQLQDGTLKLYEWQVQMAAEMKMLHVGAAAMGNGGWANMTLADWGWVGQRVRTQYDYLKNFAHDIASGDQPLDGRLLNRVALYAQAGRGTQREIMRRVAQQRGAQEERNILGAAERHCPQCPSLSALGWVLIGTLPAVGSRACLSRCHCHIETRGPNEV